MALQFVYQRAKLYRQIAMGKTHHMVVTQGIWGRDCGWSLLCPLESRVGIVFDFSFLVVCLIGIYVR